MWFLVMASAFAGDVCLPPPDAARLDRYGGDWRRILGGDLAAGVGVDGNLHPTLSVGATGTLLETLSLGVGAQVMAEASYTDLVVADPDRRDATTTMDVPMYTWMLRPYLSYGIRLLEVDRRVMLDVIGRTSATTRIGGALQVGVTPHHVVRIVLLAGWPAGTSSVEATYAFTSN
jgi:hypothetical protein